MTESRDFLAEFEQLRVETDGIRDALVSKTAHLNSSIMNSGIFGEIMRELKTMRTEIKENQEKNDKKMDELKKELLQENLKIQKKIEENEKNTEEKLSKTMKICERMKVNQKKNEMKVEEMRKELESVRRELDKIIPIRQAVIGEWKCVEHENFEGYIKFYTNSSLELFSQNLEYERVDGKLKQTYGAYKDFIEGGKQFGAKDGKDLFVEGDHVKTFFTANSFIDRYIENGKLHVVQHLNGDVWKRVYEKI